jgi:hypothetical protein
MKKFASTFVVARGLVSLSARWALAVLIVGACGGCEGAVDDGAGAGAGSTDQLGQVSISLSVTPTDILCLRVTGDGPDRTVVRDVDLPAAGDPISATLTGIPLGPVTFTGQAFGAACTDVTASTIADWISDPTTVSVSLSHIAAVALTMHRNGRAKVTIDFSDEPLCSAVGAACVSSSTCCSHSCSKGVCVGAADGGTDGSPDGN